MRENARLILASVCVLIASPAAPAQSILSRVGAVIGDPASQISAASLNDELVVTGIVNGQGPLTLTAWNVTQDGVFTREGTAAGGTSAHFVLVNTGNSGVVTVLQAGDGTLKLIDWLVSASGTISRAGSIGAGSILRLAAAPVGDSRILTVTQGAPGVTELIVWDLDSNGNFTRRGSVTTSVGTAVAAAVLTPTLVASAIRNSAGNLEVSTFSLNAAGNLVAIGTTQGPAITSVAATGTSVDRVITASALPNHTTEVDAWTVSGTAPVLSSSAQAGAADEISIAAMSGVKAAVALRERNGLLAVITWQVSDTVTRLAKVTGGSAGPLALVTLGWDRIVTPVQAQDGDQKGKLKLIDWGDASVGLIRSSWDATSPLEDLCGTPPSAPTGMKRPVKPGREQTSEEEPDDNLPGFLTGPLMPIIGKEKLTTVEGGLPSLPDPASPPPSLVFTPDIGGVDPMIAVGQQYVVVSEQGGIEFLAKSGPSAGTQLPSKAGEATCLSTDAFFEGFTGPTNGASATNRSNINLYQRLPANTGPNLQCDPTDPKLPYTCINDFYDTRVTYDPYRGVFIILSAARSANNSLSATNTEQENETARRFIAIAVSRTEDPRDGFDQWITTESNYTDWPRMATADGILIAANNGCKDSDANQVCGTTGAFENVPLAGRHQRPMAVVFRLDDMIDKSDTPHNWKIETYQAGGGGTFVPVIHHGDTAGFTHIVQPNLNSTGLTLWRFSQPAADWSAPPPLTSYAETIPGGMAGFLEGITIQNGALYFGAADQVAARVPNVAPARWRARGMRINLISASTAFGLLPCPGSDCLTFTFGVHDGDDPASDVLSYELPSMAVTGAGDMVLLHGRVPVTTTAPIGQEARYRVFYHDNRGLQDGAVLHAGSPVLKAVFCSSTPPETTPTAENYFHVDFSKTCPQPAFQDYGTAFADPNGASIWFAHAFATPSGFKMVGGMVTP